MRNLLQKTSVLILTMAISLSGCGKNENSTDTPSISANNVFTEKAEKENSVEDTPKSSFLSVGDYVTFGTYEQDNNEENGTEPIKWQVADINEDKALFISKYVIDCYNYNEPVGINGNRSLETVPWASSSIYKWLNNDFINSTFTPDERNLIVDTTDMSKLESEGVVDMIGSVFLLSYEEAVKYFEPQTVIDNDGSNDREYELSYSDRAICRPTPYALSKNVLRKQEFTQDDFDKLSALGLECNSSAVGKEFLTYWLRSSLSWDAWFTAEGHALCVEYDGTIRLGTDKAGIVSFSNEKTSLNGVRPCVWIKLDGAENIVAISDGSDETWLDVPNDNDE